MTQTKSKTAPTTIIGSIYEESLKVHELHQGVLEIASKVPLKTVHDLSVDYTPGVAEPCREIAKNEDDVYTYTSKGNLVAVVTDGSAVLGLGNIGAHAAMPVMEGKAIIFKTLGGVDAFPICLDTNDTEEIIKTVKHIAPTFGGINLEDISAPRCFEIEKRLRAEIGRVGFDQQAIFGHLPRNVAQLAAFLEGDHPCKADVQSQLKALTGKLRVAGEGVHDARRDGRLSS